MFTTVLSLHCTKKDVNLHFFKNKIIKICRFTKEFRKVRVILLSIYLQHGLQLHKKLLGPCFLKSNITHYLIYNANVYLQYEFLLLLLRKLL